jgi:hypothetical protein
VDATFGERGLARVEFPGDFNLTSCVALAIQADGKIIAGGQTFANLLSTHGDFA